MCLKILCDSLKLKTKLINIKVEKNLFHNLVQSRYFCICSNLNSFQMKWANILETEVKEKRG